MNRGGEFVCEGCSSSLGDWTLYAPFRGPQQLTELCWYHLRGGTPGKCPHTRKFFHQIWKVETLKSQNIILHLESPKEAAHGKPVAWETGMGSALGTILESSLSVFPICMQSIESHHCPLNCLYLLSLFSLIIKTLQ